MKWNRRYPRKFLRWLGGLLLSIILLLFLLNIIFPLPDKIEYSTIVTGNRGELLHAYLTSDDKWRMKTELNDISPLLRKTIVAKEDKYFYRHPGINPLAVGRAFFRNLFRMKRTSGASTITMQVARALEPGKRNIWNKIRESFRAIQLELKYSKDEILQMYLNLVPYGSNIEGVKTAAFLYFNKSPDHLSLAEITALSIIPNRPSSLVIGRHNDHIVAERNRWLRKFSREKLFTAKQIEDAMAEPLEAHRGTVPRYIPHLAYKLKIQLPAQHHIKTNIELNTQLKTEKIVADYIRAQRLKNIRNASVVIIDNKTGNVISYLGSADFYDTTDGGQVNGASAVRQPGSTLKPLLYALCFDAGLLTPKSVLTDIPVNYEGYAPENYDKVFNGYVTTEYALEHSLNIPAVKSLKLLGREKFIAALTTARFRQIQKDQRKLGLSMILGGCGTSLEELTGLFATFASEGTYSQPRYSREDVSSRKTKLISPAASFMITEILSKVNRPDFPLNWSATEHMPKIAWKTGTSYGRRDAWSIGYNKNFTVGVWVGNFSGVGVAELSGANVATPLLFRIFNTIDYDNTREWFNRPNGCELRQVCSETGMSPSVHCDKRVTDYFVPLVSDTRVCDNRQEIAISPDESISYCKSCMPTAGYRKKMYRLADAGMQAWFAENKVVFDMIPGHNPDCETIFKGNAPVIVSPAQGTEYLVSKKHPEPLQLSCKTANDVNRVYWYIDNKFYKAADAREKQFFLPSEGPVKISCTDDKGRNRDIRITVRYVNL